MTTNRSRWRTLALVIVATALAVSCTKRPASIEPSVRIAAPPTTAVPAKPDPPVRVPTPEEPAPEGPRITPVPVPEGSKPVAPPSTPPILSGSERPVLSEFAEVPELKDIFFDFDRYAIRPDAERTLAQNLEWMQSNPNALILIEGHCDERGTSEYNLALGERRAQATRNFLVSHGVRADRITLVSYGKERPGCSQSNEECWARNRRAHFLGKRM
jgi:peptidoglycan-associated lipoprotein